MLWTFPVLFAVVLLLLWVVGRIARGARQYHLRDVLAPRRSALSRREVQQTKAMAMLSLVYLTLIAAMLPQASPSGEGHRVEVLLHYLIPTLLVWALFWVDFIVDVFRQRCGWTWRYSLSRLCAAAIPPFRLALPPAPGQPHWVPFIGWRSAGRDPERSMEHGFSVPMMVMALLVLPILAVEFIWAERIDRGGVLDLLTDVGTRAIWLAFAVEFLVMWSVSPKKIAYCKKHWLDLAIILLPLISFLRSLRVLRAARLAKVQKMSRVYRLRGLAMRFFRTLVVFKAADHLGRRVAERRLKLLRASLTAKEEELEELRKEIAELEKQCAESKPKASRTAP